MTHLLRGLTCSLCITKGITIRVGRQGYSISKTILIAFVRILLDTVSSSDVHASK